MYSTWLNVATSAYNFQLGGNSGIAGLLSGYAHLVYSFCIETLCFATVYLFVGLYYLSAISNLLPLCRVLYLQKMALITDFCPYGKNIKWNSVNEVAYVKTAW